MLMLIRNNLKSKSITQKCYQFFVVGTTTTKFWIVKIHFQFWGSVLWMCKVH